MLRLEWLEVRSARGEYLRAHIDEGCLPGNIPIENLTAYELQ